MSGFQMFGIQFPTIRVSWSLLVDHSLQYAYISVTYLVDWGEGDGRSGGVVLGEDVSLLVRVAVPQSNLKFKNKMLFENLI